MWMSWGYNITWYIFKTLAKSLADIKTTFKFRLKLQKITDPQLFNKKEHFILCSQNNHTMDEISTSI